MPWTPSNAAMARRAVPKQQLAEKPADDIKVHWSNDPT